MVNGMQDALKGCMKEEMRMDIISNNIANINVIGFKRTRISFRDILRSAEDQAQQGEEMSVNSKQFAVRMDLGQGDVRITGNPLDFAIHGEGFFKVETSEGIRYTRKGNFTLDPTGVLITQDGDRVIGTGGAITIPQGEILVDGSGAVKVDGNEVGRIAVVNFENHDRFVLEGKGLYKNDSEESEGPQPNGTKVRQAYVELSNVSVAQEMIQMIQSLRAFESYQKAVQVLDSINGKVINDVGR